MAVHTYKELRDMVLRLIGEEGDTVTENVVKDVMNQMHVNRVGQHPWPFMVWPKAETITVTAGVRQYALHQEFGKGLLFYNTTADKPMRELPARAGEDQLVSPTQTEGDDTLAFRLAGSWPVKVQPTAATTLTVVSTSASDVTSYTVIVKGETSDGDITTETFTLTGTTPVTGSTSFTHILGVTLSAATNGTVTLATSGGTTLLKLYAGEYGRTYRVLELVYYPSAGATLRYTFRLKTQKLVNDYDVPQLPDDHALLLVYDTLLNLTGFLHDVDPAALGEWKETQTRLERNLYLEHGFDQQTLNAQPNYIKYTGDY